MNLVPVHSLATRLVGATIAVLAVSIAAMVGTAGPAAAAETDEPCSYHYEPQAGRAVTLTICEESVYVVVQFDGERVNGLPKRRDNVYVDRAESGPNPSTWEGWLGNNTNQAKGASEPVERDPSMWHDDYWFRGCVHDNNSAEYFCTRWHNK